MSVKLMAQVWELRLDHPQQSVLLALADHSHDDGSHVYPGVPYLAWKTGYSERNIQRILRELESAGLIVPEDSTQGGALPAGYRLDFSNGIRKQPYKSRGRQNVTRRAFGKASAFAQETGDNLSPETGDRMSPVPTPTGDICDNVRVTNSTRTGDIHDSEQYRVPARLNHKEPSLEPSTPYGVVQNAEHSNVEHSNAERGSRNAEYSNVERGSGNAELTTSVPGNLPQASNGEYHSQVSPTIPRSGFRVPRSSVPRSNVSHSEHYDWLKEICGIRTLVVPPMWKRDMDDTVRALVEMAVTENEKALFAANWPKCYRGRNGEKPTPREVWAHWSSVVNYRDGTSETRSANERRRDAIVNRRAARHNGTRNI